jgi:hypothetical protein
LHSSLNIIRVIKLRRIKLISHPKGGHRLRVFENSFLRRMAGPGREKKQKNGENFTFRSSIIY